MDSKPQRIISYAEAVESLGLHKETGIFKLDVSGERLLNNGMMESPIVFSDSVVVWICRGGNAVISIGETTHTIVEGYMLVAFAGTRWYIHSLTPDFEASVVMSRISTLASVESVVKTFPRATEMPVVQLHKQEEETLMALMGYIEITSRNHRNPSREEIDNNILAILRSELTDIFLRRNLAVREATEDERLVKRFNMMLAVSCFEHRDVEHYASEFNIHPKRFAAKVRRITGTTPSDLITSAVIKNAKRLLVSTELSSYEIAEKLNFSTPSFFCRYFKRYVGVAPQEWREQNKPF